LIHVVTMDFNPWAKCKKINRVPAEWHLWACGQLSILIWIVPMELKTLFRHSPMIEILDYEMGRGAASLALCVKLKIVIFFKNAAIIEIIMFEGRGNTHNLTTVFNKSHRLDPCSNHGF